MTLLTLADALRSTPLHEFGGLVRDALLQIPLWGARALFIALPAVVLLWVLRLPREETTDPAAGDTGGTNLKWGAAAALVVQIAIYALI